MRVRNDLPVPDLPNIPFERSIKRDKLTQMGVSMLSGFADIEIGVVAVVFVLFAQRPFQSRFWLLRTPEKSDSGIVFTGLSPDSPESNSAREPDSSMSIGCTLTVPKVENPESTSRMNSSFPGGLARIFGLDVERATSVNILKKRVRLPSTTTKRPTRKSSTDWLLSSRISSPVESEPWVMMPR